MLTWIKHAAARLRALFRSSDLDSDLTADIDSHGAMLVEENIRRGMTPQQAEREARLELGAVTQLREAHREVRSVPFVDTLMQDLQYTFRTLRRDAGFTTFAILIVGLGIGASSTVFSVVNALLLRPLPFHDPTSLMWIANGGKDGNLSGVTIQVGHLLDLRENNKSFSDLAAYMAFYGVGDAKLTSDGEPQRLSEVPVSQNFFPVLGVKPILGRT